MRLPSPVSVGRRAVREFWRAMLLVTVLCAAATAMAQNSPDRIMATVIRGLQTGQINQSWFGQQLLQTIHQQTNGTFIYQKLVELGPVQNVQVTGQQPVNQGVIYAMRVTHSNGTTEWQMGISQATNRIEYLAVNVTSARATPPPSRQPSAPPPSSSEPQLKPLPPRAEPQPTTPQPTQPQPVEPRPPQRQPPVAGPPMPTPSPVPPSGGTGGSEACRLYPNLC